MVKNGGRLKQPNFSKAISMQKSKEAINRDLLRIERETYSPLNQRRGRASMHFAKHVSSYTRLATIMKDFKSSSDVALKQSGSAKNKFPQKINEVQPFSPLSKNQMIQENLLHETESLNTYKTDAFITFSNGAVLKGVLELDKVCLCIKQSLGGGAPQRKVSGKESELTDAGAVAGPTSKHRRQGSEVYQIYDSNQIFAFKVLRNTFVLTLKALDSELEGKDEEEQQICLRVNSLKVPILKKLL